MKKRPGSFTGIRFRPAASLYLGESEASLTLVSRSRFFSRVETRHRFQAESLQGLLEQVRTFLRADPPARLTVVLDHSYLLERTVFLPFRGRKQVSMVLPAELGPLLPQPLSEYYYQFSVPEAEHLPVTVFLLPASVYRALTAGLEGIALRILPVDLALSRHPLAARAQPTLFLLSQKSHGRLLLFEKGKYLLGRSFSFGPEDLSRRFSEESGLFLRSSRLSEMKSETVVPDERLVLGSVFGRPLPALRPGGAASARPETAMMAVAAGVLAVLWLLFFTSFRARGAAQAEYQRVNRELSQQKELAKVGGASLSTLFSDKNVSLLLQDGLSPLETFGAFNAAVPKDLPLVLDYLQIDRQKLLLTGTLNSPEELDTLTEQLDASGRFEGVALGELKLEGGTVTFPLTAKVIPPVRRPQPAEGAAAESGQGAR